MEIRGSFIDGEWRDSSGDEFFTVINPYTEEPTGRVAVGTAEDVDLAVQSSYRALTEGPWASTSLADRIALVRRIAERLAARDRELGAMSTASMGGLIANMTNHATSKPLVDMYVDSVERVVFEYLRMDPNGNSLVTRRPIGVSVGIVPWNAPIRSELKKVIPAILAGCTSILKPAPEAPFGAAALVEICSEAGAPPGVVNLVPGGPVTGEALITHPLVRQVTFTGSSAAGSRIAQLAGEDFTHVELELGGKSAAIVLEGADLGAIAGDLARGIFNSSGQACTAESRLLVHRSLYDDAVEAMAEHARRLVLGDPMDPSTTMGPLAAERQRTRVLGYIEAGQTEGAKLVVGGRRPSSLPHGWFVEPTVFAEVDNAMKIAQEEIFGPVLSVIPFDDDDEAVRIANDSVYGLGGSVHSDDPARSLAVARRVEAGHIGANKFKRGDAMPFGGVKRSGVGREQGPEGYDAFLQFVSHPIPDSLVEELAKTVPVG